MLVRLGCSLVCIGVASRFAGLAEVRAKTAILIQPLRAALRTTIAGAQEAEPGRRPAGQVRFQLNDLAGHLQS